MFALIDRGSSYHNKQAKYNIRQEKTCTRLNIEKDGKQKATN